MKNGFFSFSKDRGLITNIILCLLSFFLIIAVPLSTASLLGKFIEDGYVLTLISNVILASILYLFYFKDLNKEAKTYKDNFKKNINVGFKYWGLGLLFMVVFNAIIMIVFKNISQNETQVREMLYDSPVMSLLSICIFAPLTEEIIFRKSLSPIFRNRIIYAFICGLLFGGAHILTNIMNNSFALTDLIYILPYASLGCAFALMDYDTKSTFTSIVMHAFHNTMAAILLLIVFKGMGV